MSDEPGENFPWVVSSHDCSPGPGNIPTRVNRTTNPGVQLCMHSSNSLNPFYKPQTLWKDVGDLKETKERERETSLLTAKKVSLSRPVFEGRDTPYQPSLVSFHPHPRTEGPPFSSRKWKRWKGWKGDRRGEEWT